MTNHQLLIMLIDATLLTVALLFFVPAIVLFIECTVAALTKQTWIRKREGQPRPNIAVLVPAHNEAAVIKSTLRTLLPQLTKHDRLVVIADNCSDETAAIARSFRVTVLERWDLDHRGKGYALDYGLQFLEADPPDVVVTVDSDCLVARGAVAHLAQQAFATNRPVQSAYLMSQPNSPTLKDSISMLAIVVKNLVRPIGLSRLGLPCLLTGSGMAFPWLVIRKVSLANSKTADDMQLGIDLAIAGHAPTYCPQAQVTGRLMSDKAAQSQRSRWEHGHLETLLTETPRLLKAFAVQRRFELLALALELCVPPLSLLILGWFALVGIVFLTNGVSSSWIPEAVLALQGLLILLAIAIAWFKFGRSSLPLAKLMVVPFYILWKIPLYLRFLVRPQTRWVRTERDSISNSEP